MNDTDRLIAIEDIRRVMARYVYNADHHRFEDLAGLFTPDGTFTPYKPDGSMWMRMEGREGIATSIGSRNIPGDVLIHHLFSDEIDVESENTARGTWAMEDIVNRVEREEKAVGPDGAPVPMGMHGFGHYHGRFVKIAGTWYIAELKQTRLRIDFTY
ncbi:nuclear transport factor 2 family protein [Streptomyces sp. NBC_01198]|uniref:nuclear transport factor 2 family protein n=1 Tax=Streptomyces sp. NBC_01198 TaxID=2903769 RepID=UPI002E1372BF|nr:nuclear transport factor 2 family protein [Streptomyces sp. NBC_01198]